MSKVQRKEYQETKIMRTVSPGRPGYSSSQQDLSQFDNRLDHLLDDLQSSVSGGTPKPTRAINTTTTSVDRITHLRPSNPTTEYTTDDAYNYTLPDGSTKSYKKESYSYSSSGERPSGGDASGRYQNNISQLDSLLDDLKQVKRTEDANLIGTHKSRVMMGKKVVERELHYGEPAVNVGRSSREGSVNREIQYLDEGTYGETRPVRYSTPSPNPTNQLTTTARQKKVTNVQTYPVEVIETTTPGINPEILSHLDPNLLPAGNTKVTTTIKTYTYEIPGSGVSPVPPLSPPKSPENQYVYSPNDSQTTPSRSFVYNKTENRDVTNMTTTVQRPPPVITDDSWKSNMYKEIVVDETAPLYQKPASPASTHSLVKETTTTRRYQPNYPTDYVTGGKQTYIYNETTTTRNLGNEHPPPPQTDRYIMNETRNTSTTTSNGYPAGKPESYENRGYPVYNPPNDVNLSYKYSTHSTTHNTYRSDGDSPSQPLLPQPRPFPTDAGDGPPRRVDELMAKMGNEPPDGPLNIGFQAHEAELVHQKKVETLRREQREREQDESLQRKERTLQPTKNITGPPVYYPPGHEMFAKKEESAAAWKAQGGWERESGKYEREAESSSKYQVKTGAAMVPVCLPCCCGLPCVLL